MQLIQLAVFDDRGLPPGGRLDRAHLRVLPDELIRPVRVEPAPDGGRQGLVEAGLRLPYAPGEDVLAGNRRKRYGGQQPTDDENEDQTPQTPHRRHPFRLGSVRADAFLRLPATRS